MKLLVSILLSATALFSGHLIVKDNSIDITINEVKYNLREKEKLDFDDGSTLCVVDGKGRIIINGHKQLSIASKNCIQTKVENSSLEDTIFSSLQKALILTFSKTEETFVNGVSSKGNDIDNKKQVIKIKTSKKYIVIRGNSSGPLPITLQILNEKNEIIKKILNEDNQNSIFIINNSSLFNNYHIKILDGFGKIIKHIVIKK
jgi:hypothetical protein